jgi:hypothetical protein
MAVIGPQEGSSDIDPSVIKNWQDVVSGAYDALKAGRMNGDGANSKAMAMKLDEGHKKDRRTLTRPSSKTDHGGGQHRR